MSAVPARSIRREEESRDRRPLVKVRALQRTLYRCAKQEPERRFHALYLGSAANRGTGSRLRLNLLVPSVSGSSETNGDEVPNVTRVGRDGYT
jgi:hypothetical protein